MSEYTVGEDRQTKNPSASPTIAGKTVDLTTAFSMWMKCAGMNFDVCIPAQIVSYTRSTHKAVVQPLLKKIALADGESFDPAPVEVSVWRWQSGGFSIDLPMYAGQTGWLIASDRNASLAKEDNSSIQTNPDEQVSEEKKNKGVSSIANASEEIHSFVDGTGFFFPDMWGVLDGNVYGYSLTDTPTDKDAYLNSSLKSFQNGSFSTGDLCRDPEKIESEGGVELYGYRRSLVLQNVDPEGKATSTITINPNGDADLCGYGRTETEKDIVTDGSRIRVNRHHIIIQRWSNKVENAGTDEEKTTKIDDVFLIDDDGIHYEGIPDRKEWRIVDIRYNLERHQLEVRRCEDSYRGDLLVSSSKPTDWMSIEGGWARPIDSVRTHQGYLLCDT